MFVFCAGTLSGKLAEWVHCMRDTDGEGKLVLKQVRILD